MSRYSLILSSSRYADKEVDQIVEYITNKFEYKDNSLNSDQIKFKINIGLLIRSVSIDTEEMTCVVNLEDEEDKHIDITELKSILREEKLDNLLNN